MTILAASIALYNTFYIMSSWFGAVYPVQTQLKTARFHNGRWWKEGKAKPGNMERTRKDTSISFILFNTDKDR